MASVLDRRGDWEEEVVVPGIVIGARSTNIERQKRVESRRGDLEALFKAGSFS